MKRFLYLFIIVAAIVLVVLVGYFLRQRAATPTPGNTTGNLPSAQSQKFQTPPPAPAPQTPEQAASESSKTTFLGKKFGVVAQNKTLNFFVDGDNNVVLVQPDGQVVKITNGDASVLSSSAITNLREASFSYDGKKVLAVFGNRENLQASIFDIANKSWQPLQLKLMSAAWSPNSYEIAYLAGAGDAVVITTFDATSPKAKPRALAKLHLQDVSFNWPTPNKVIIADKPSAFTGGSIWNFDIKQKTLVQFVQNRPGLESAWSRGDEFGLTFEANQNHRGGKLILTDNVENVLNNLAFLTLPSKCVFDIPSVKATNAAKVATSSAKIATSTATAQPANKFLYCAIPQNQKKFAASELPDDYEKTAMFTTDDIFRVNLNFGAAEAGNIESVFSDQEIALDATNLKIFNQILFFVNRIDQKLYAVSLK